MLSVFIQSVLVIKKLCHQAKFSFGITVTNGTLVSFPKKQSFACKTPFTRRKPALADLLLKDSRRTVQITAAHVSRISKIFFVGTGVRKFSNKLLKPPSRQPKPSLGLRRGEKSGFWPFGVGKTRFLSFLSSSMLFHAFSTVKNVNSATFLQF